ncbi:MAG TPA: PGPGW domain-containing protein [Candidatus Saccharimonadia bacterium]|nr:PGPGW domain-containing protein [Candidatus Saccharimonadia bacterium]
MNLVKRHGKRVLTDAGGYLLVVAGIATGWLPGPGGIPLIVTGLGLLSINNAWAKELRIWVIRNGGKAVTILFPRWVWLEWLYDIVAFSLLCLTFVLEVHHVSLWQMGLGVSAFFIALFIALTNRDRLNRLRGNYNHKR